MTDHNPAVEAAIEGELSLLDAEVRRSSELLGALLHPGFREFGSSGRVWTRSPSRNSSGRKAAGSTDAKRPASTGAEK
ncbi:DUF4440 domain-containing protein [Streptomyces sp. NPDC047990]|uniref:DUF4440 domain-containing protein n=1 Tax=Streptomyces sp. NPDC047990 TaxID=3365496 RepID=UPI003721C88F